MLKNLNTSFLGIPGKMEMPEKALPQSVGANGILARKRSTAPRGLIAEAIAEQVDWHPEYTGAAA